MFIVFDIALITMEIKETPALKRNNVKVFGNGTQPMLFAHGYGCDHNMWRYIYPAFEENYQIILFDHTGAGNSDERQYSFEKYDTLEGYTEDILEICEELNLQDVIFVAHSVSSMIAVLAAVKEPGRFSKLILIGPSPRYINDDDYYGGFNSEDIEELMEALDSNYLGWAAQMAPVIMGNRESSELGEELTNSFCSTNPAIAKHFARVTFLSDNRQDLQFVKVPTLVMQSSEDVIAPKEVGEYVHKNITNSQFKILNATGHCPNLSAPEETIAVILEFLNQPTNA
ncbi:alpha/beta hydrolase [Salegentibacter sp. JZCK2]|uniref:alpha/beta fold hydrolase n=1 Tax=Salegentibacter tibetensis TaxID=2873600 RepID=UPI001CCDE557|nr:alpha/beta hydrolase [Salegentibacter tibetensis]MBZ9728713.1 alpha/beta hydrolase [Salegentibacter tibetensis]